MTPCDNTPVFALGGGRSRPPAVVLAGGTGGLRHFLRWEADGRCAVARCGPAPPIGVAGDVTGYRAEPVPVLFGRRILVADGDGGYADVTPGRVAESAEEHVHDAVFLDNRDHGWAVTVNVGALASWVLRTVDGARRGVPPLRHTRVRSGLDRLRPGMPAQPRLRPRQLLLALLPAAQPGKDSRHRVHRRRRQRRP